jgi:DNA repair protein RecO (recombination protein O)
VGESDIVAVIYTRNFGRLSGIAKGARRPRSRFAGKLQPLSLSELILFSKEGRDLASIDKVDLIQSFGQRTNSYRCLMQLQFLAELLAETTPERERNDSLFRLLLLVLPQLTHPATADLAQVYFELWYLRLAGLFPEYRSCHLCKCALENTFEVFVECMTGGFFCPRCRGKCTRGLSEEAFALLGGICRQHLTELSRHVPATAAVRELGLVLEELLQNGFEKSFFSIRLIQ